MREKNNVLPFLTQNQEVCRHQTLEVDLEMEQEETTTN